MKSKYVIPGLAAIAIVGFALFVMNLQPRARRQMGASAVQTTARKLASTAESVGRELVSRNPSELPGTTKQALELVPFGTPLEAARQAMTEHHFTCSVDSYTDPAQMPNSTIWSTPLVKGGERLTVTNVTRLTCKTNGCTVTFWLVNGETTSVSVRGQF